MVIDMNRWDSRSLHEELALFYSQYRSITAPRNTFTEDLWAKIEQMEEQERNMKRAARKGNETRR